MVQRDVKVVCPCCESVMEVDTRSGSVLRWKKKDELDASGKRVVRESDWDSAAERAQQRRAGALDKFDASLKKEVGREQDLDDLFDQAEQRQRDKRQDF